MKDVRLIDELVEKLSQLVPTELETIRDELATHFKQVVMATFAKMDLVTREEFDIQKGVLAKTRAKLDVLERSMEEAQ